MTITVINSASISVPADYFGPGKEAGPNAVDAFIAAATAVGVGPMDVQVVGDPAAKKYAEEHLPQLQRKLQRNNAAVHVPKVEAAAETKPLGHVYRESKTLPAEDAERLHWNVNESVKESGMGVRAPAKPAIRATVAHKEREHQKEQEENCQPHVPRDVLRVPNPLNQLISVSGGRAGAGEFNSDATRRLERQNLLGRSPLPADRL